MIDGANLEALLASGYQTGDPYRRAIRAADAALTTLPPELQGDVFSIVAQLATCETIYQGLHGLNASQRQDGIHHPMNEHPSGIERLVCDDITRRQQRGIQKYGTTVADNPLPLRQWLEHAYEEALDMAVYLRRAMDEIDRKDGSE